MLLWKNNRVTLLDMMTAQRLGGGILLAACLGLGGISRGQDAGHAHVTLGSSDKPQHVRSAEILLEPLERQQSAPVVTALACSPDAQWLAAAGDDHAIRIINVESGKTIETLLAHSDWIQALVFSSDGQYLYSAGNDGRVLRWRQAPAETSPAAELPERNRPLEIARAPFAIRAISLATEKQLLAIAGFYPQVVVWDLAAQGIRFHLPCNCRDQRCVRFSPDGNHLLCGSRDGSLRVWRISDGQEIAAYKEHQGEVQTAAFTADGAMVNSVGNDRQLVRYDLAESQVQLRRELASSKLMSMCMINDELVAVSGADNCVHLYDAVADEVVAHLKGHFGTVAVMTPCGDFLASGSFDTTVRIWDLASIDAEKIDYGKPVHAPMNMDDRLRIR